MKKRVEQTEEGLLYKTKNRNERALINTLLTIAFVSVISVFVGGVVMLYSGIQKEKNATPVIVSYEEGLSLNNIIDKLDMLDLLKKDYTNLSDEDFLVLVASMTKQSEEGVYKVEDLNKTANQYFNKDIKIVKFNCLDCPNELYIYDEATNSYRFNENHQGHGVGYLKDVYNLYFSSKREGNTYYVTVLKAFSNSLQTGCGAQYYYDSLTESNKVATLEYNMETCELLTDLDNEINNNKGKLNKYTYTFEKENDKFILKSIELEK